jgi:hypothetical protein
MWSTGLLGVPEMDTIFYVSSDSSNTSNAQQNWSFSSKIKPLPSGAQRKSLVSNFSDFWKGNYELKRKMRNE